MTLRFDPESSHRAETVPMTFRRLPEHAVLAQTTRLPLLGQSAQALPALEFAALLLFGGLAACSMLFLDFGVRMPGHAVLRAVLPMACGLAVVPRRGAGLVMGGGALLTLAGLSLGGHPGSGTGSTTSLLLIGPMMDAALWSARPGLRLYLSFALAGFATNLVAFLVRGAAKAGGGTGAGGRAMESWLQVAVFTYAACGLLAGLISAAMLFHWSGKSPDDPNSSEAGRT
jgi:hypothetical protein